MRILFILSEAEGSGGPTVSARSAPFASQMHLRGRRISSTARNFFRMRSSEIPVSNPFGMRSSKTLGLNPFGMNTYTKVGGAPISTAPFPVSGAPRIPLQFLRPNALGRARGPVGRRQTVVVR